MAIILRLPSATGHCIFKRFTGATVVAVRLPLLLVLRLALLLLLPLRTRNTCPTSICEVSRRLFQRASVFTLWPKRRPMR